MTEFKPRKETHTNDADTRNTDCKATKKHIPNVPPACFYKPLQEGLGWEQLILFCLMNPNTNAERSTAALLGELY